MGYETRYIPQVGEYITLHYLWSFPASDLGLKALTDDIRKFMETAIFKLTDVYWGGRASPSTTASIGEFSFRAYDPDEIRECYDKPDADEKYLAGVETLNRLVIEAKKAEDLQSVLDEQKELLRLLEKYGIPDSYADAYQIYDCPTCEARRYEV